MTLGIPTDLFLQIHVALSLIALVAGLIVVYGLLNGRLLGGWTELFLVTIILTSVTGFPLPPFGLDPPRMVGILSLILLAVALAALYVFRLSGPWRWIFVVAAMTALYLDAFVGVIQAFAKVPFLHELAPTGSEPPFLIVQVLVLAIFVVLGFLAVRRFRPAKPRSVVFSEGPCPPIGSTPVTDADSATACRLRRRSSCRSATTLCRRASDGPRQTGCR